MERNFNNDLENHDKFVVTLELVPGRESNGRRIDTIRQISRDALQDGRISAVSITDNPGGNPALSPDVLGREIREDGMDVIVHFTCRDANRVGMESRALQLAHMGMTNILALTGDYAGKGFGGRGTPVFDFDSVVLTTMFTGLSERLRKVGYENGFKTGCAVSPFKYTEAETLIQYRKLLRKVEAGATYTITQLGYDIDKYRELLLFMQEQGLNIPAIASLFVLDKRAARAMHAGRVPGVHVSDRLAAEVASEWADESNSSYGKAQAIERTARLGALLKGIGYRGIHLGGIHSDFAPVAAILDRMEELEGSWQNHMAEFQMDEPSRKKCFYLYRPIGSQDGADSAGGQPGSDFNGFVRNTATAGGPAESAENGAKGELPISDSCHYLFLKAAHDLFFDKSASLAPVYRRLSSTLDSNRKGWLLKRLLEDPFKKLLLSCQGCGDCGIQHVGFLCPESGCPKHTRNGACGGSSNGYCEVNPERLCVWVRAFKRMKRYGETEKLGKSFVPPRLWELKDTSSWINFHLDRDHQRMEEETAKADFKSGMSGKKKAQVG